MNSEDELNALHLEISDAVELIEPRKNAGDAIEDEVRTTLSSMTTSTGIVEERSNVSSELNIAQRNYDNFVKSLRKGAPFRIVDGKIIKLTDEEISKKRSDLRLKIADCELRIAEMRLEGEQIEERIGSGEKPKIGKRRTKLTGRSIIQGKNHP